MNRRVCKCGNCKRAFIPTKIDQKYCSHKCRQSAYRKRVTQSKRAVKSSIETSLVPAICLHCHGSFEAKTRRGVFCSTSCRTLYHRALKASIPNALMALYNVPADKAADIVETQPLRKLRQLLESAAYIYNHSEREWIRVGQGETPYGAK